MPNREDIVYLLTAPLNEVGCWRTFNDKWKYWNSLRLRAHPNGVIRSEEVPEEPQPSDFEGLGEDCEEAVETDYILPTDAVPDGSIPG